jgi:hypothetical protein
MDIFFVILEQLLYIPTNQILHLIVANRLGGNFKRGIVTPEIYLCSDSVVFDT